MALTIDQLNQLATTGAIGGPSFSGAVGNTPNQVVVLNQGQQAGCIPCGDSACPTVAPTQTSAMDLSAIQGSTPSCVQWDVANTTEAARYITIGGPENAGELPIYALASAKYFSAGTNAMGAAGFTTNGNGAALDVQYNNTIFQQGALLCSIELNINTIDSVPNHAFANTTVTVLSIPKDPANGTCGKVDYAPFCSACVTNDNSGFVTKLYTIAAPIGAFAAVAILVPAGATGTVRPCYAASGIINTALASGFGYGN